MAVKRNSIDIPQNLVNQIRSIPQTGSIFGDVFDSIRRAMMDLDTRISGINTTGSTTVSAPAGTATASYDDGGTVTPFTGASARDLSLFVGDRVSVLDFGADPTGVVDSTSAFNNAITAVQSGLGTRNVYVPWGIYKIGGTITIGGDNSANIIADPGTILNRAASFNIADPFIRLNSAGSILVNLTIKSNNVADTLGIRITGPGCELRNVTMVDFGRAIYTTVTANGLLLKSCDLAHRAAATLPLVELVDVAGCAFIDNTFYTALESAVVETGTATGNYIPIQSNRSPNSKIILNPTATSTSGAISKTIVIESIDLAAAGQTKVSAIYRDATKLHVIDQDGATARTLVEFDVVNQLATFNDLSADQLSADIIGAGLGAFSRLLALAGGHTDPESDAIPDTTALLRFRPADDAVDISVTAASGARVWKQLFPFVFPPTAENVASVSITIEYQTNENNVNVKWRAVGVITFGDNRTSILRYVAHLVGPAISGVNPLMDQEFGFYLAPPAAPDTDTYFTSWFDLPTDADTQYKVAIWVYGLFDTPTPGPTDSGYVTIETAAPPLALGDFSYEVTVVYYGAFAWAVDWNVTLPTDRTAIAAIVPKMLMAAVGTEDPWIQELGEQDVPTTGPAVFRTGRGDWLRPEVDTVHTCKLYFRDIYNRLLGPIDQPISVIAFDFHNISSISLTFNIDDLPGFARFTGTAVIPTSTQDAEFAGVRIYGFYGDPTGITFDDLFIVSDVDHEAGTAGPMTFDFTVPQHASLTDLRLYFAPKHQDIYADIVFAGPSSTPFEDFTIPVAAGIVNPPSDVVSPGTITLTGTDPLTRILNCSMSIPTAPNGFDGVLVYKLVGGTDLYQLGFAHHPVGTGSPVVVAIPVFLPEADEVDDQIFFQAHANTGMVADLVLTGGSATPSALVTLPARPTSTSTAPLADPVTSISATVDTKPGFFRFSITITYPTPRASIIQTGIDILGPYVSGIPERNQFWSKVTTPGSGNYTAKTGWFQHDGAAEDYILNATSYNEDDIPTLPPVASATITVPTAAASGGGALATGLTLTRLSTPASGDGVEQTKMKVAWTNPSDQRVKYIYGTVRVTTQAVSEEQLIFTRNIADEDSYSAADTEGVGPWPTVAESYIVSIYSVDFDGNTLGPATVTLAVTLGTGSLNLARAATASYAGTNFTVSGGQFKIKTAGVTSAELDSANIFVTNFAGNLDIARINNAYSLNIDNFAGTFNASKIYNLGALNIGSMAGNINFTRVDNLGSFNIGSFAGVITTSQVQANFLADLSKFAQDLRPIGRVTSLPGLPNSAYPINTIVLNASDSRLYKTTNGTSWTLVTASDSISGKITNTDILSVNASVINGQILAGQINGVNASSIIGQLSASQINTVNATSISGTITSTQIGSINASTITIGQIVDSQINTVSVNKLTVGTLVAGCTINSPIINITSSDSDGGFTVTISNSVGFTAQGGFGGTTTKIGTTGIQLSSSGLLNRLRAGSIQLSASGGLITLNPSGGFPSFQPSIVVSPSSGTGFTITPTLINCGQSTGGIEMNAGSQYISTRELRLTGNLTANGSPFMGGPYTLSYLWYMWNNSGGYLGFVPILN